MSGYSVAHLDAIEQRPGGRVPVRAHFDITAFGVNAWTCEKAGDAVISEHTERIDRHEELYLVVKGGATFTVDGEDIAAPPGTIVVVNDPDLTRKAVAKTDDTMIIAVGAQPGTAYEVSGWEHASGYGDRGMVLYREKRYAEAAEAFEEGAAAVPDFGGAHYNAACMRALTGDDEAALAHLRRAIELDVNFAELATTDSDFDPIRDRVSELIEAEQ